MKRIIILLATVIFVGIAFFALPIKGGYAPKKSVPEEAKGREEEITLAEVPAEFLMDFKKVAPGFEVTEVERKTKNGEDSYSLEGKSGGYEVETKIGLDDDEGDSDDSGDSDA